MWLPESLTLATVTAEGRYFNAGHPTVTHELFKEPVVTVSSHHV